MAPRSKLGRSARQGAGAQRSDSGAPPSRGSSGTKPGRTSMTRVRRAGGARAPWRLRRGAVAPPEGIPAHPSIHW
eukprot:9373304-Alexandrium_andersonii.AAC.1